MAGRRKVLAAAALWGACAWFLSLDVDFLVTNLRNAPHWLLQGFRALFMGVSVAMGYAIYRKYLLEIRTRSEKYAKIREEIRRLLADLLTTPDEDLIRQLHRTIKRIEQGSNVTTPKPLTQVRKEKSQRLRETRASNMTIRRQILTSSQSTQEGLDIERERCRSLCCMKQPDGLEKRGPTPDAITVLRSEDRGRKVNLS